MLIQVSVTIKDKSGSIAIKKIITNYCCWHWQWDIFYFQLHLLLCIYFEENKLYFIICFIYL